MTQEIRKRGRPAIIWTDLALAQLGLVTDKKVAKIVGASVFAVRLKRRSLGIQPLFAPDSRVIWSSENLAVLGKKTDKQLAALVGASRGTVSKMREKMSIPALHRPKPDRRSPKSASNWTAAMDDKLGKASDRTIAAELGLHFKTVANRRKALNIAPSSQSSNSKVVGAHVNAQWLHAWQVRLAYSRAEASAALGLAMATYTRMLHTGPTRTQELACRAVEAGLG